MREHKGTGAGGEGDGVGGVCGGSYQQEGEREGEVAAKACDGLQVRAIGV